MSSKSKKAHNTPEQALQSRVENFNNELKVLLGRYNLQLGARIVMLENGAGIVAQPTISEAKPVQNAL